MPKLFQMNHGGDATNNPGWTIYPQNVGQILNYVDAGTPLHIAAHHGPGTYLIAREIRLGDRMNEANPGLREYFSDLLADNAWPVVGDILGLVTVPHASAVRTISFMNCCPAEGITGDLVRVSDGAVLRAGIDLSVAPAATIVELPLNSFITPYGKNDIIGLKLTAFPTVDPPTGDCLVDCMASCGPVLAMCFNVSAEIYKGLNDSCPSRCF